MRYFLNNARSVTQKGLSDLLKMDAAWLCGEGRGESGIHAVKDFLRFMKRGMPEASVETPQPLKRLDDIAAENREILCRLDGIRIVGEDFMKESTDSTWTKIIANPPFSGNQDIRHIMKMYQYLAPGGTLAAIAGVHWKLGQEELCVKFRQWLEEVGAEVHDIAAGEFKSSGTTIPTTAIVIHK